MLRCDVVPSRHFRHDYAMLIGFRDYSALDLIAPPADGQPRCEYQCGRVAPKRQLYGQPYMRTDPIKTDYIFRIRSNAARWGQSTAYANSGLFA
jgi:hypothetical protein